MKDPRSHFPQDLEHCLNFLLYGEWHSGLLHAGTECKNSFLFYQQVTTSLPTCHSCWKEQPLLQLLLTSAVGFPECHPDHRNSPLDIQIPALSFSPSCTCCLFAPLQTTSHPYDCFLHSFVTSLSCFNPPVDLITYRVHCSTVLSWVEFSAVHNSLLHKCSSLNTACSPSASVPHLPLPFSCTALSWAS